MFKNDFFRRYNCSVVEICYFFQWYLLLFLVKSYDILPVFCNSTFAFLFECIFVRRIVELSTVQWHHSCSQILNGRAEHRYSYIPLKGETNFQKILKKQFLKFWGINFFLKNNVLIFKGRYKWQKHVVIYLTYSGLPAVN